MVSCRPLSRVGPLTLAIFTFRRYKYVPRCPKYLYFCQFVKCAWHPSNYIQSLKLTNVMSP